MTQILKDFILGWGNLKVQQQLSVLMISIIFALAYVIVFLFQSIENKIAKHDESKEKIINKIVQKHEIEKAVLLLQINDCKDEINDCKDNRFDDAIFFRDKFFELNNEMR